MAASAIPVLPEVASTTVPPSASRPVRCASRSMYSAARSFTLDIGLNISSFASNRTLGDTSGKDTRSKGVLPTRLSIDGAMPCRGLLVDNSSAAIRSTLLPVPSSGLPLAAVVLVDDQSTEEPRLQLPQPLEARVAIRCRDDEGGEEVGGVTRDRHDVAGLHQDLAP